MELSSLRTLQRLAGLMRRANLDPVVATGRALLGKAFKDVSVQVDGLSLTSDFRQRACLHDFASNLDSFQIQLFKKAVKPGAVVLDIGAHIGWYTLQAARGVGPTGVVYAFEPDSVNFATLSENVRRNGFAGRVVLCSKAVCDAGTRAPFFVDKAWISRMTGSLVKVPTRLQAQTTVECIAIDEFLDESVTPEVVKLDIEGAEIRALRGMEKTLRRSSDSLTMFVECNPNSLRAGGFTEEDLLACLKRLDFVINIVDECSFRLCPLGPSPVESSAWGPKDEGHLLRCHAGGGMVNLLCARSQRSIDMLARIASREQAI